MAISINPTATPLAPVPQQDAELQQDVGEKRADKKQEAQQKQDAKIGEQQQKQAAIKAAISLKDVMALQDPKLLLALLAEVPSTPLVDVKDPKGSDEAQRAFASVKELLGKPTGERLAEPHEYPALPAMADVSPAFSDASLQTFVKAFDDGGADALKGFLEQMALTGRAAQGHDSAALKKLTNKELNQLQSLAEKVFAKLATPASGPMTPEAIQKAMEKALPQLQAALKGWLQHFDKSGNSGPLPAALLKDMENAITELAKHSKGAGKVEAGASSQGGAARAGAQEKTSDAKSALPQAVAGVERHQSFADGWDFDSANIADLVYRSMRDGVKSENGILRDQLREMQEVNKQKAAMSAQINKAKREQADVNKACRAEYDYLVDIGAIDGSLPFDPDYKQWRQITTTKDGEMALSQPMPEIPEKFTFPAGPPEPPGDNPADVATGAPGYELNPEQQAEARAMAEALGLPVGQVAHLYSYFIFMQQHGSSNFLGREGNPAEFFKDMTFDQFVALNGLKNDNLNKDELLSQLASVFERMGADTGHKTDSANLSPTSTELSEWDQLGNEQLASLLASMLNQPPYSRGVDDGHLQNFELTIWACFGEYPVTAEAILKVINGSMDPNNGMQDAYKTMINTFMQKAFEKANAPPPGSAASLMAYKMLCNLTPDHAGPVFGWSSWADIVSTTQQYEAGMLQPPYPKPLQGASIVDAWNAGQADRDAWNDRNNTWKQGERKKNAAANGREALSSKSQNLEGEPGAMSLTQEQLTARIGTMDDELQSMSEMSQMKSMRLQATMDRRKQMLEALTNILAKVAKTFEQIAQN